MVDARLYNREAYAHGFGDDDSYTLYDKPLFAAQEAAAAIYRPKALDDGDTDLVGGGTEEGVRNALTNDRFNLGVSKAFEGADPDAVRDGPVQFKKDEDVFNIDNFLEDAAKSAQTAKRTPGLDTSTCVCRLKCCLFAYSLSVPLHASDPDRIRIGLRPAKISEGFFLFI